MQSGEAGGGVEGFVGLVEEVFGRMVDIEENGVKLSVGCVDVEAGSGEGEEIALAEFASGIVCERLAIWDEGGVVPIDHRLKEIDD